MEERIFLSQKYFIFKLADILNNSFHVFEEKRLESLSFLLKMCLETYDEMNGTVIGMDKLEKSYKSLLNALLFQLKKHPIRSLHTFRQDFIHLKDLIMNGQEAKANSYEIYICMKSLKRKLDRQNICEYYVECLQNELSYQEVDDLIEALVSDLLFKGYTLNFLYDWYKQNIKTEDMFLAMKDKDVNLYIRKLVCLDGEKKEYEVVIPYKVNNKSQKSMAVQLLSKNFQIKKKSDFDQFTVDWRWQEEEYACKVYFATDYDKAIKMAKKEFATECELFAMWQGAENVIRENKNVGCISGGRLIISDIRKVDNTKLISYFDQNRMEQLNNFIELKDSMKNEDVDTLDRILHTLHTAKTYNIQNRYLNFWSALEYVIYPFNRNSIIEKARIIIPEVFTLFYIKNKMNIFWERLSYTMKKRDAEINHPGCKKFIDFCRFEKGFDTKKMISFLQDAGAYQNLVIDIGFNIVLQRELQELIMLVTEPNKLKRTLIDYNESISHDLDCIYRLRNQLIHSAKGMDDSLEDISLRLYRYVNSIVATILYYKKKDAKISIVEILNSLHNTYEAYMEQVTDLSKRKAQKNEDTEDKLPKSKLSLEEGYKMVRPHYLFIE